MARREQTDLKKCRTYGQSTKADQHLPRRLMTLNIKDPEARDLAQALARETGETMTTAVIEALRDRLARAQRGRRSASAEELLSIGQRCAQGRVAPALPHGDMLYDERGLPR
jgi:antitoxin VapB